MKHCSHYSVAALGALTLVSAASAAEVLVSGDITTSQTWTSNNVYNLQGQVYVLPGATLTIQAGTVIASDTGGSLAITRDAKLLCIGTQENPVIFTSKADRNTWAANPPQGVWRATANEWGNLTIMGNAYIGKYGQGAPAGNTAAPNAANYANMEGLTASSGSDTRTRYGGGNDDDDSGTLRYVSIRYGGKVVGLGNELNGLSLGGIGRGTEIDHIEIMNNVDDGIEIWGGTVDLRYVSIWNVGDDSLDIDQGWRGRAQFGLIVGGYSIPGTASGSGFLDKLIEADGAEKSDAQPVSTFCLYNFTLIGQPFSGRNTTAWRDNCRGQMNNFIYMQTSGNLVQNDNTDGEATGGQTGYGFNGTLTWPNTWTTNYNVTSTVNPFPSTPGLYYKAQSSGKLIQYTDSVFWACGASGASAYTEATARGVFNPSQNNTVFYGTYTTPPAAGTMPIAGITRGTQVVSGTVVVLPVTSLDPRAANSATTSVNSAPNNGFFVPAQYRGAFASNENWLCNWTAAYNYGMVVPPPGGCQLPCAGDLDNSGTVDGTDLGLLLGSWGSSSAADLDLSGTVDGTDLGLLLGAWGPCN